MVPHPLRCCFFGALLLLPASVLFAQEIQRGPDKMVTGIRYLPIDQKFLNPIDPSEEAAFWDRVRAVLMERTKKPDGSYKGVDSRTFFESEKWSYPSSLWHILAGNVDGGMKVIQSEDDAAKSWHQHTEGIDLFPGFTVQGQVAKYFFSGNLMTPEYKSRMDRAIKQWTATNPRTTPHPVFKKYNPEIKDGWGPDRFGNKQVDTRRTDAMWGFTGTAIYLFAEASGNEAVRQQAKDEILRYVWSLYNVGMGEWDSSTYLPFSVAPYLNLHAYAKDPEVRMAAKLALDYYHVAAALKYRKGLFSGTSKRDYGNAYRMNSGGFNTYFPLIFGGGKDFAKSADMYAAYAMISPYRPPAATLALARRKLSKSMEVLASKPAYQSWEMTGEAGPSFFETLFLAKSYDLSSVVGKGGADDIAPFRLTFDRGNDSAAVFLASSRSRFCEKFEGDGIGQYRNLLVWLSPPADGQSFRFALPTGIAVSGDGNWQFADTGTAWIAVQTFGLEGFSSVSPDEKEKKDFPDTAFFSAKRTGSSAGGFALLVAEKGDYPSFGAFKDAVKTKARVDSKRLAEKSVRLTAPDDTFVEVRLVEGSLPEINRNGEVRDWSDSQNWKLWQTVNGDLVSLGWKEGTLRLACDSRTYTGSFTIEGWQKPDASPKDLEVTKNLKAEAAFSD